MVTDAVDGFSVTLPAGYTRITDKAKLRSVVKAGAATAGPRFKALLDQYESALDHQKVTAFKLSTPDYADNFNIIVDSAGQLDAEHIGDGYLPLKQVLEGKLGATITSHRVETVAGTNALRIEYRLPVAQKSVRGTQVYLIYNGKILILSIGQNDVGAIGVIV